MNFELAEEQQRSAFWLSTWARRAAEENRTVRGRPVAWPERTAVARLANLWDRRTGSKARWSNNENDGGAFCRAGIEHAFDLEVQGLREGDAVDALL